MINLRLYGGLTFLSLVFSLSQPISVQGQTLPPPPPLKVPTKSPVSVPRPETTLPPLEVPASTPPPVADTPTTEATPTAEIPVSSPSQANSAPIREFTFQAPSEDRPEPSPPPTLKPVSPSQRVVTTNTPTKVNFYRVEVSAADEKVLEQVKAIEPFAFLERDHQVVYAGRFHQQDQAQQRVEELSKQGLSAQVVPVKSNNEQQVTGIRISPR